MMNDDQIEKLLDQLRSWIEVVIADCEWRREHPAGRTDLEQDENRLRQAFADELASLLKQES